MQSYIIKGAKIYAHNGFEHKDIVIKNNVISAIDEDIKASEYDLPIIELSSDDYVIPGFIDIHIHGSRGADIMDADIDALQTISKSLYKQGVTSYLATTMTASNDHILRAMNAIKSYNSHQHTDSSKIVGFI